MTRPYFSPSSASVAAAVPSWAVPPDRGLGALDAAFAAGAALHALDSLVRGEPVWAGAWRQRLAAKCAAGACRLVGRAEDEAALRDAWHLRKPGDDPGPAGNIFAAWRQLAMSPPAIDVERLAGVVEKLGLRWDDGIAVLPEAVDELLRQSQAAPFAVAALMRRVVEAVPGGELLAWWLGDVMLAASMRWPRPVPLLMAQALAPVFRADGGRNVRIRPGDEGFDKGICLALARGAAEACRMGGELSRRAERLQAVTPKLRAKGAGEAIVLLLNDDVVPGSLVTKNLSRFASRRLFERLQSFGAVRELSGRDSFRLFGL